MAREVFAVVGHLVGDPGSAPEPADVVVAAVAAAAAGTVAAAAASTAGLHRVLYGSCRGE